FDVTLPTPEPDVLRSRAALMRARVRGGRMASFTTGRLGGRTVASTRYFGSAQRHSDAVRQAVPAAGRNLRYDSRPQSRSPSRTPGWALRMRSLIRGAAQAAAVAQDAVLLGPCRDADIRWRGRAPGGLAQYDADAIRTLHGLSSAAYRAPRSPRC